MPDCPTCGEDFDKEVDMKIHHKLAHGESIAKKESTCVECGVEFRYYESNRSGVFCHECSKERNKEDIRRRLKQVKLAAGCKRCGYDEHATALCFHHVDEDEKKFNLGSLHRESSWGTVLEELRKCEVLCRNCHAVVHYA